VRFFFSSRRRHTRSKRDWSSDVCSSDLLMTWGWDNGSKAFNTEYMNNPIDEESMIFNPQEFTYWDEAFPSKEFSHDEYIISVGRSEERRVGIEWSRRWMETCKEVNKWVG